MFNENNNNSHILKKIYENYFIHDMLKNIFKNLLLQIKLIKYIKMKVVFINFKIIIFKSFNKNVL